LALSALVVCGGCGSSSSSTPTSPSSSPAGATTIAIIGQNGSQAFSPNPANFGGQMVVFKNNDSVTHHVVLNDGSVDAGDIAPGGTSRAVAMPSTGTNYHCTIHPGMIGSVAGATGGPAPTCTGAYCDPY
jgi:plastocyanin